MSSPSRKVGLRKRLSIAVNSAAFGAATGIAIPFILYRNGIRAVQSGRKRNPIDWDRLGQTIHSSGVLQMLMTDMIDMRATPDEEVWVDDDDDDEDFREGSTVH